MSHLAELSVEWVAAMLRHWCSRNAPGQGPGIGNTFSLLEDGLSQSLGFACRSRLRSSLWMALFLALFGPSVVASVATASPAMLPSSGSGNVSQEQSGLARRQGMADTALLDWVMGNSGPLKGDIHAGELRVAFTVTPAEGWWDKAGGGKLAWHDAPADSVHLRIFVVDLADGRFVPGLSVHATLTDSNGNRQIAPVDFGWYPLINAYGGNFPLESDSGYTLRVTVDPPSPQTFGSKRFRQATIAEFPPVQIAREAVAQIPLATATGFANEAELLRPCNAALSAAITALWQQSVSGLEKPDGDYYIGYALDFSSMYGPTHGAMIHIGNMKNAGVSCCWSAIRAPADSFPVLSLRPLSSTPMAKSYGPGELFLSWYPWLDHYGRRCSQFPARDCTSCACNLMHPVSAVGAGRVIDSPHLSISSSITCR